VRCPSSDGYVYQQIFLDREYDFTVRFPPRVIIDAGANIGLASVYFAARFPEARIIAIEPEDSNVELLRLNTRNYPNVVVVHGALWSRDEQLHVLDRQLGKWGFMTAPVDDAPPQGDVVAQETRGITVPSLLDAYGIGHVDIFKIDIEGAEKDLFEHCETWIARVDALIVELHDRMKPGCSDSFNTGALGFEMKWRRGENEFRARQSGCIDAHREPSSTGVG
jgi:FkbM family methyltransferase